MDKLVSELRRLYFLPGQLELSRQAGDNGEPASVAGWRLTADILSRSLGGEGNVMLSLVGMDGMVRTMVVSVARGNDWAPVAALYEGVQKDLDLPAPAVSVSVEDGYQVWFSLAEPVSLHQARAFLNALRRRYLAGIPVQKLKFLPGAADDASAGALNAVSLVPALEVATGRWSAFIDPTMGSMFADETWLDMAPGLDKQAAMLAALESIKAGDVQRVLGLLEAESGVSGVSQEQSAGPGATASPLRLGASSGASTLDAGHGFTDPKRFLLAVMNDCSADPMHRIEAAKALLPYFESAAEK